MDINQIVNDVFKIVLNILLVFIAIVAIVTGLSKEVEIGSMCSRFIIAVACIITIFTPKYRYVFASITLSLMVIAYFLWR